MSDKTKRQILGDLLEAGTFFAVPGVFDLFSALIADRMGFPVLYMTGYGVSVSQLGQPDAGIATYSDFVGRLRQFAESTSAPIIADADTGFGGLVNIRHTVRGFEAAGAAAIQIEDQEFPKKCGHTEGKRVVPMDEMALRIKVAVDSRRSDDMLIVARTDSRAVHGFDDAMRRAEAMASAGADILFIEAPESREELEIIGSSFDLPVIANMNPGPTKTPEISAEDLKSMGFAFSIYPGLSMMSATAAMERSLGYLKKQGSALGIDVPLLTLAQLHDLSGFPEIWEFERRWGGKN